MHGQLMLGFALGVAFCALLLIIAAAFGGKTNPDPERRTWVIDRRQRHNTRRRVDEIADHYGAEALTYMQASSRLRDHEVPADTAMRVLKRGQKPVSAAARAE